MSLFRCRLNWFFAHIVVGNTVSFFSFFFFLFFSFTVFFSRAYRVLSMHFFVWLFFSVQILFVWLKLFFPSCWIILLVLFFCMTTSKQHLHSRCKIVNRTHQKITNVLKHIKHRTGNMNALTVFVGREWIIAGTSLFLCLSFFLFFSVSLSLLLAVAASSFTRLSVTSLPLLCQLDFCDKTHSVYQINFMRPKQTDTHTQQQKMRMDEGNFVFCLIGKCSVWMSLHKQINSCILIVTKMYPQLI